MVNRQTAEAIQLRLEYNPAPPFNAGSPDTAPAEVLALMNERIARQARRARRSPAPRRGLDNSHRGRGARLTRTGTTSLAFASRQQNRTKKKAAWFPRRPFLSSR